MSDRNKAFVQHYFDSFSAGNTGAVKEMMASDHLFYFPFSPEPMDRDTHAETQILIRAAVPDLRFTIEDQVAEGDKVVTRWVAHGTHQGEFQGLPPTGNAIELRGINIMRIVDGKNVEEWDSFDTLSLMQKFGAVPAPA